MVEVQAALHLVPAPRPRQAVGILDARLAVVVHVGRALAHDDEVGELERRLLQDRREIERAPGDLHADFAHQRRGRDRHQARDDRLIARHVVAGGAGRRRGAAAAAEEIVRVRIEKVIADRQRMVRRRVVVQLQHERVIVVLLQLVRGFLSQAELGANGVERGQIVLHHAREPVRLVAHLSFVVAEEKGPIRNDRRAERQPELILMQDVRVGRVEDRPRVQPVVHSEIVERAVPAIGPRLGDNVHEPAQRTAVLRQVGGVEDAELLGRLLRRRRARQSRERLHVVGAVDLNHRVQLGLAAERQSRGGRGPHADIGLLERAASDVFAAASHAARQLDEIDEVAPADRERFNLLHADDAAQLRFARFDERGLGDDGHLLGNRAEAHPDVRLRRAADGQHDTGADGCLEAGELGVHVVFAGIERRDPIAPF